MDDGSSSSRRADDGRSLMAFAGVDSRLVPFVYARGRCGKYGNP